MMKIRTGFVTNSSSESYGEVVIDNPVLLEILARYKALGVFNKDVNFKIGVFDTEDNYWKKTQPDPDIKTITPAFHSYFGHSWYAPSTLDEVLENLIEVIDDDIYFDSEDSYNKQLYQLLKEELLQREEEIKRAFKTIKWFSRLELYSGRFGCWEFKYDQEMGEYYHEEETGCLDH